MRRWFLTCAVLANALAARDAPLLIVLAAAAFVLNLLLVPVLVISTWTRNRELRGLTARLVPRRAAPPA